MQASEGSWVARLRRGGRQIATAVFPRVCESTGEPLPGLAASTEWEFLSSEAAEGLRSIDNEHACECCGVPIFGVIEGPRRICAACREKKPKWDRFGALLRYHGPAREWVRHYKYRNARYLEREFAKLARAKADDIRRLFDGAVIVPVPLHPLKEFLRGFNQAEYLARIFVRESGADAIVLPHLLRRVKWTRAQASLRRHQRVRNVKNAFDINRKIQLNKWQSRRVVVVDDLLTSGSTVSACARVLKAHEFSTVDVFCLART